MCLDSRDRFIKKALQQANALYIEVFQSNWSLVEIPENGRQFITLFVSGMTNGDRVVVETNAPGGKEEVPLGLENRFYFNEQICYDILHPGEKYAGKRFETTLKVYREGEMVCVKV